MKTPENINELIAKFFAGEEMMQNWNHIQSLRLRLWLLK